MTASARSAPASAVILVAAALAACGTRPQPRDDFEIAVGPHYEARSWVSANGNLHCLASNRFHDNGEALAFIDTLYSAGAETVWVYDIYDDTATVTWEGGAYADAIYAVLPHDEADRDRLFSIAAAEARAQGLRPELDIGQKRLFFWWD